MSKATLPAVDFVDDDDLGSDSEDEGEDQDGTMILGYADGAMDSDKDLNDITISRIGGEPAFLPLLSLPSGHPHPTSSFCKACFTPMELLVQIYAPLSTNTDSDDFDRVLYVWGCLRKACQKKEGSVRVFRLLRHNAPYAAAAAAARDAAEKKAREEAEAKAKQEREKKEKEAFNPFAATNVAPSATQGLGSLIFGGGPSTSISNPFSSPSSQSQSTPETLSRNLEDMSLSVGSTETPVETVRWPDAIKVPSYPPQYLDTTYEVLAEEANGSSVPPTSSSKAASKPSSRPELNTTDIDDDEDDQKGGKGKGKGKGEGSGGWTGERYEIMNLVGVDETFFKFQERLERGGGASQCVRYEFGGIPLPFTAKDTTYKTLFRTNPRADDESAAQTGIYDPSRVPPCPHCSAPRAFELQIMPNALAVLEKERGKQREREEGKDESPDWATIICFTCSKDCTDGSKGDRWTEEVLYVQHDE